MFSDFLISRAMHYASLLINVTLYPLIFVKTFFYTLFQSHSLSHSLVITKHL